MMNISKKYIFAAFTAALAISANAEDPISKEVVIEKEVVPVEQKVNRLNSTPELAKITSPTPNIKFSDNVMPVSTGNKFPVMMPYGYKTSHKYSDIDGYADFGIGNNLNMVGSAGYKLVNTNDTKLNFWLQHNSAWGYNSSMPKDDNNEVSSSTKYLSDLMSLDFSHNFGLIKLESELFYNFARNNYQRTEPTPSLFTNVNNTFFKAQLTCDQPEEALKYNIGLHLGYFSMDNDLHMLKYDKVAQSQMGLNGGIAIAWGERSKLGIDADVAMLSRNNIADLGKLHFNPYYVNQYDNYKLLIGANLDISVNDGTIVNFSPNVKFENKISNVVGLYLSANGGKKFNPLAQYYQINRFIDYNHLSSSYTPIDLKLGVNVGPFAGFTTDFWFGYDRTDNAQLATNLDYYAPYRCTPYWSYNIHGMALGVNAAYSYQDIASLSFKGSYANQDKHTGYMGMGEDRPEYIIALNLEVKPIKALRINAGYELRGNRGLWYNKTIKDNSGKVLSQTTEYEKFSNVSNLKLDAHYQITNMIGAFVSLDNLLNKDWQMVQYYKAQGFNAMGGITLKF